MASPWHALGPVTDKAVQLYLINFVSAKETNGVNFLLQAPSYNRHNLPTNTREKQAQEILIRRQHSLRQSCRKGNSLPWGRPVPVMQTAVHVIKTEKKNILCFSINRERDTHFYMLFTTKMDTLPRATLKKKGFHLACRQPHF